MLNKKQSCLTISYILSLSAFLLFNAMTPAYGGGGETPNITAKDFVTSASSGRTHLVHQEKRHASPEAGKKRARHALGAIMLALQKDCRPQPCI